MGNLLSNDKFNVALFRHPEWPSGLWEQPASGEWPLPHSHGLGGPPATFLRTDIPLGFVGHQRVGAQVLQFAVVAADQGDVGGLEVPETQRHAFAPGPPGPACALNLTPAPPSSAEAAHTPLSSICPFRTPLSQQYFL